MLSNQLKLPYVLCVASIHKNAARALEWRRDSRGRVVDNDKRVP